MNCEDKPNIEYEGETYVPLGKAQRTAEKAYRAGYAEAMRKMSEVLEPAIKKLDR